MTALSGGSVVAGMPSDLTTMTPVEAANQLFDKVMRAVTTGDSTEAQQFMPMDDAPHPQEVRVPE